jgi:hypothetical protein
MEPLNEIPDTTHDTQPSEQPVEVSVVGPSVDAPGLSKRCSRCLTENPDTRNHCHVCGGFLSEHSVTPIIHGGRRRRQLADPEHTDLFQSWAADLGGIEQITTGQRVLLRRASEADLVCKTAFAYLSNTQQSWSSRRVQTALITLAQHSNTIFRVAAQLGISRHDTPKSPLDAVRQAVQEANSK